MLALTAGGRRAGEQPTPKANPPHPSQCRGGKVTLGSSTGCSQLPLPPPLSVRWSSLQDNYRQITPSKQHSCLCSLAHSHLASISWKEISRAAKTCLGSLPIAQ